MIVRSAVLLFALAFVAPAQPARGSSAVIFGSVSDTGLHPVVGADVNFAGSRVRASTDSTGRFQIVRVPAGKFILIVRNIGFRPAIEEIETKDGDTLRLAFSLEPVAHELSTTLVTERGVSKKLEEFDQRRRLGFGEFFTHADIEKINVVGIEDILRRTKSVRVSSGLQALSAREGMACPMVIYIDAFPMGGIRLDHLPSPKEIAAIEVYAGSATLPLWLATGPTGATGNGAQKGCGAILIWTNDGSIVP